jgi:hypothetical protein
MHRAKAENREDIENVDAWAEVIGDLLHHVPSERRSAAPALASKNEEAKRKEYEANDGWREIDLTSEDWMNSAMTVRYLPLPPAPPAPVLLRFTPHRRRIAHAPE